MKKISLLKFEIISFIFISILGTLLHFTYEWSNNNSFIGLFSAINESTWEHLKLIFFPMLITTIIGTIYYKNKYPNKRLVAVHCTDEFLDKAKNYNIETTYSGCKYYLYTKTKAILLSLAFIIIFFYTSIGVIGKNITILNIASFFISIIIGEYYVINNTKENSDSKNFISFIILLLLTILFITFTFVQPNIGIFEEPPHCIFIK